MVQALSVQAAARLAITRAGGARALATALGIRREAVFQWRERGIPPIRVLAVAAISGLTAHELRPDVFPAPVPVNGKPKRRAA